jgi:catechol 2,3-dioxygenase
LRRNHFILIAYINKAVQLNGFFVELYVMDNYKIPPNTRIGHIHLKVSDLNKALSFYRDILGFEVMQHYGNSAVFVSAGGYHHHIGLNTWHSKNAGPAPANSCGLYHTAILYPTRKDLAVALQRLIDAKYPLSGASDHGVSEAIYLDDPDGNGVELYWDKPREQWPFDGEGNLGMITQHLDLQDLLAEAGK